MQTAPLRLMDLGTMYMLVFDNAQTRIAVEWYRTLGAIDIMIHDLGLHMSVPEKEMLEQVLGKTIDTPYGDGSTQYSFMNDIKTIGNALTLMRKWKPCVNDNVELSNNQYIFKKGDVIQALQDSIPICESQKDCYILYNTHLNRSIVIHENTEILDAVLLQHTEFQMVACISKEMLNCEITTLLGVLFKGKMFKAASDATKKFEAFLSMYPDIQQKHKLNDQSDFHRLSDSLENDTNEKKIRFSLVQTFAKNYITFNYTITNDVNDKIKMQDLMTQLAEHYGVAMVFDDQCVTSISLKNQTSTFRKYCAIAIDGLDGVVKKRFSDGYYYCGIKSKFLKTNETLPSLEEIVKSRKLDMECAKPIEIKC